MNQKNMLQTGDRVVMGVSGGADSVALLMLFIELAKEMQLQLFVVHIHHGIRAEAQADATYVKQLCDANHLPFYLFEENIPLLAKEQHMSEEEMGRVYRYQCFAEVMKETGANKLAVAHHKDDQVETILFHLIRGTDLTGVTGMKAISHFDMEMRDGQSYEILRPLLCCTKADLIDWLKQKNISWKEDVTNQDNQYSRNKLRNQIIPLMNEINDKATDHIVSYGEAMEEHQQFVMEMVEAYIRQNVTMVSQRENQEAVEGKKAVLNRQMLLQQNPVLIRNILYNLICQVAGKKKDITREHTKSVTELLLAQSGKEVMLPYGIKAYTSYEKLILCQCLLNEKKRENQQISLDFEKEQEVVLSQNRRLRFYKHDLRTMAEKEKKEFLERIINSKNHYTKFFDCDTIKDTLCVRTPELEDYFLMNADGNRKKISRYFIDIKLPLEERKEQLLITQGHEVLWIVTQRRCEQYKVNEKTNLVLEICYEGEKHERSY